MRSLPRIFAIVGLCVGLLWAGLYFYDYFYNPFHLPTVDQAQKLGNYEAPAMYRALETTLMVMLPGLWLSVFTMDMGSVVNGFMWALAITLNIPIYYGIGTVTRAILKAARSPNSET